MTAAAEIAAGTVSGTEGAGTWTGMPHHHVGAAGRAVHRGEAVAEEEGEAEWVRRYELF